MALLSVLVVVTISSIIAAQQQAINSKFSCNGRTSGYYADVQSGCQVYHMCDGLGRQFSYTCPNATLFQQRMLICDHWYMVNCSKSERDYSANLRIGHRETPFVDDAPNPYRRTPRPDLLLHPSETEHDIIYRTGRKQFGTSLNLVGAESVDDRHNDDEDNNNTYAIPSHWSTQYEGSTNKPVFVGKKQQGQIKGKPINPNTEEPPVHVNFESSFKATTPVFPLHVDDQREGAVNFKSHFQATTPVFPLVVDTEDQEEEAQPRRVNFDSLFKATTPVFPLSVESTTVQPSDAGVLPPLLYHLIPRNFTAEAPVKVNFESSFKATTPVYPTSVEATSVNPSDLGILPPQGPPGAQEPSKFNLPPKETPQDSINVINTDSSNIKLLTNWNSQDWDSLRRKLFIPEYEFPLESASRPSYETVFDSFQADERG